MGMSIKLPLLQQVLLSWLILYSTTMTVGTATREIQETARVRLHDRLQEEGGGMMECWNALLELKSCTNEIVMFFFNGDSYLGMDCCRAIRVITHHCWPSMLTSLGYTSEEGDILRDYCGRSSSSSSPQPSTTHA